MKGLTSRLQRLERAAPMTGWAQLKKALKAVPPTLPDDAAAVRRVLYDDGPSWDDVEATQAWAVGALAWAKKRYGEPLQAAISWQDEIVELVARGEITADDVRAAYSHHTDLMERIEAL